MIVSLRAAERRGGLFLERIREAVVVADGAMGTALYGRGVFINQSFDALCLTRPELVSEVHRAYRAAGAELLETNSFGANRARLAGHGLEDQVREINTAAVRLAREAASDAGFVGGSMGPIGVAGQVAGQFGREDLVRIFEEQAGAPAFEDEVRREFLAARFFPAVRHGRAVKSQKLVEIFPTE